MQEFFFIIKAILLGVIEGVTEFLPVSSTGHLIIGSSLLKMPDDDFMKMFMVVIQLGAILAVLYLFWPKLWDKLKRFFRGEKEGVDFVKIWVLGCVPAAVLGLLLDDLIDEHLFSTATVTAALAVGAIMLFVFEQQWARRAKKKRLEEIKTPNALWVGAWQCLSLWPGFSRSAATLMGGWQQGMTTALAAEYSFFLAIPVMFGASGLKLIKFNFSGIRVYQYFALIAGFLVAFLTALLVVRSFLNYVKKKPLALFALYRIGLAALLLLFLLTGVL